MSAKTMEPEFSKTKVWDNGLSVRVLSTRFVFISQMTRFESLDKVMNVESLLAIDMTEVLWISRCFIRLESIEV